MGLENVKHIVLVLSGKGGVGKSSVTTQLALALNLAGHSVGILDVDLTGPSIPRMLAIEAARVTQAADGWQPVPVHKGDARAGVGSLHAMSLGLLLARRGDAVVWRGPKKTAMIRQLLSDVAWPPSTEYLLIDTPPGTSDEHISLVEALQAQARGGGAQGDQVAGAVVVTTPQAVAMADVRKELNFCRKTSTHVLGVVENMAGFICPHCSDCTDLFGGDKESGGGRAMAAEFGVPFLGSVPIDPQVGDLLDQGRRPEYPTGTAVLGFDVAAPRQGASGRSQGGKEGDQDDHGNGAPDDHTSSRDKDSLVDKYADCALAPIFADLAAQLRAAVAGSAGTG